jgi:hypothetical protein
METKTRRNLYCSNQIGWSILEGMEEVMGQKGLQAVRSQARFPDLKDTHPRISYPAISRLQAALEEQYGPRSGRGLAQRVGRASFHYGLKVFGDQFGLTGKGYRLLPPKSRIQIGAGYLAEMYNQWSSQQVDVVMTEGGFRWTIQRCPVCWGRKADTPVCHLVVGFLQEFLYWASGGKPYFVGETACVAAGAPACVFTADRTAYD